MFQVIRLLLDNLRDTYLNSVIMEKSLVTILIPAYNVEAFLSCCLDSVLGQTYKNLQVVIIDDGSKDKTLEICKTYFEKDPRIEYYTQENQGVASTRNNLLEKVKGDYVLFVDADDWIEVDMIDFLLSKANETQADLVTCGNVINDTRILKKYSGCLLSQDNAIERFLYHKEFRGSLCTKLFKYSAISNCRFIPEISLGEDALFCWHALQNTTKIFFTDHQLYHYRMNADSICHGTFSSKKLSAHFAWEKICTETESSWFQYLHIARARHCVEDVLLLRDAVRSNYSEGSDIRLLQSTISKYWHYLNEIHITSFKMKMFAAVVSKFRCFAKFF